MTLRFQLKPYIQPFERQLAISELASLTGSTPHELHSQNGGTIFEAKTTTPVSTFRQRLAYWEYVIDDKAHVTVQSLREASVNLVRNGVPLDRIPGIVCSSLDTSLPNRRTLRYASHGLHEYRGKFFPQLVRALLNSAGVRSHDVVADPMSGSGTTLVESVLTGCNGIGVDINPLSVFMSRTKCAILSAQPAELTEAYNSVQNLLLKKSDVADQLVYFPCLPTSDQDYLSCWLSEPVIAGLDRVTQAIQTVRRGPIQDFMWLCLSNIVRTVSWQKDDDLRVRKEVHADVNIDPVKEFLLELNRCIRVLLSFLFQNNGGALGVFDVRLGSACDLPTVWRRWLGKCDAVITSPPYATALPYIDTDRLSLCYLGLLTRADHRKRELEMIGNREITERLRNSYLKLLEQSVGVLPESILKLIKLIETLNLGASVGFRRRNLPALLTKYFLDMRQVLTGIAALLKPGRPAYIVIGNNHTIAGGQRVEIHTAKLLSDLAGYCGLTLEDAISMEMLTSRDIFKHNAVGSEEILCLRSRG